MFRERLALLINKDLGLRVCGEADSVSAAMALVRDTHPDIAIVDITLRGSNGLELLKDIKAQGIRLPVLVLSMHEETLYAERSLRAGARGYIMKSEASSEVVAAIRRVLAGEVYVSNRINSRILSRMAHAPRDGGPTGLASLTDRELEVFELVGSGRNSREIAVALHLGESTIETYRARIKEKLGLRNAAEMYQTAARWVLERASLE